MRTIVVAGDLIWSHCLVTGQAESSQIHQQHAGGAWFLGDLIRNICEDSEGLEYSGPAKPEGGGVPPGYANEVYSVSTRFPVVDGDKKTVYRTSQMLGRTNAPHLDFGSAEAGMRAPDLCVIDDLGLDFRHKPELWPRALGKDGNPGQIVLKTCAPLCSGPLWQALIERFADRLTVVLRADDLRQRGAMLSRGLSWDSTVEDVRREFLEGNSSRDLSMAKRVIIGFGYSGAASFTRCRLKFGPPEPPTDTEHHLQQAAQFERFLYHPDEVEGIWEKKRRGGTDDALYALAASVARYVTGKDSYPLHLALGRGLAAARAMHEAGYGESKFSAAIPLEVFAKVTLPSATAPEPASVFSSAFPRSWLSSHSIEGEDEPDLLYDLTGFGLSYIAARATQVVLKGPAALKEAPKAVFGKFMTVDREEIERINALRNLIVAYQDNPEDTRPLSIAVFGPPGSGKSFAIKQLASELMPGARKELTFNLSQLASISDLHEAFHQVRDASVKGQVPLVFWDEFDSRRDGQDLGWLKEFLAPMQDAEFYAGGVYHPFGKAIFVFAGGTERSFERFDRSRSENKDERTRFSGVKGPDFISRLRGVLNVKGPNPQPRNDAGSAAERASRDPAYLIRRAILLRAALSSIPGFIGPDGTALVSGSAIHAFLHAEEFYHGARSLESIVKMSQVKKGAVSGAASYGVADLPPKNLLSLHVSPDFSDLAMSAQAGLRAIDALAEACHSAWMKAKIDDGYSYGPTTDDTLKTHQLLLPFERLTTPQKENNYSSAYLVAAKLEEAGYRIVRRGAGSDMVSLDAAARDLARMEHDIWLRGALIKGYEWASKTQKQLFLHRDVASMEDVPEEDVLLDVVITKAIPRALWNNGFTLEKIT